MVSYHYALKILRNKKKYTKEQIEEATRIYHERNVMERCPVCLAHQWGSTGKPCLQCIAHYSTQLNHYYEDEFGGGRKKKRGDLCEDEKEQEADEYECLKCGSQMVLRTNSKTGEQFYGCSQFPKCWSTFQKDDLQ